MTQYEILKDMYAHPKKYGIKRNTRIYEHIYDLLNLGYAHTVRMYRMSIGDDTWAMQELLRRYRISYDLGNDAPRCGRTGNYIALKGKVERDRQASGLRGLAIYELYKG